WRAGGRGGDRLRSRSRPLPCLPPQARRPSPVEAALRLGADRGGPHRRTLARLGAPCQCDGGAPRARADRARLRQPRFPGRGQRDLRAPTGKGAGGARSRRLRLPSPPGSQPAAHPPGDELEQRHRGDRRLPRPRAASRALTARPRMTLPGFYPATVMPDADWWNALWPAPDKVLAALGVERGIGLAIDLCCGDGLFTAPLARLARQLIAIDLDPEMIAQARTRLGDTPCTLLVGDAYHLAEMVAMPADLVFMANTFHGVPD